MICDKANGNIIQSEVDAFDKDYRSRIPIEWIGKTYGLRSWDYSMALYNTPVQESETVLDIGCGESLFLAIVAERSQSAWGIDNGNFGNYREWFDTLARFDVFRSGKATLIEQNAAMLPFPDSFFDKVFTFSALEHFAEDDDMSSAKEVGRVLKSGGSFCGTVDYNAATERPLGADNPCRVYTLESFLRRIVEPSGLDLTGEINLSNIVCEIAQEMFFLLKKME